MTEVYVRIVCYSKPELPIVMPTWEKDFFIQLESERFYDEIEVVGGGKFGLGQVILHNRIRRCNVLSLDDFYTEYESPYISVAITFSVTGGNGAGILDAIHYLLCEDIFLLKAVREFSPYSPHHRKFYSRAEFFRVWNRQALFSSPNYMGPIMRAITTALWSIKTNITRLVLEAEILNRKKALQNEIISTFFRGKRHYERLHGSGSKPDVLHQPGKVSCDAHADRTIKKELCLNNRVNEAPELLMFREDAPCSHFGQSEGLSPILFDSTFSTGEQFEVTSGDFFKESSALRHTLWPGKTSTKNVLIAATLSETAGYRGAVIVNPPSRLERRKERRWAPIFIELIRVSEIELALQQLVLPPFIANPGQLREDCVSGYRLDRPNRYRPDNPRLIDSLLRLMFLRTCFISLAIYQYKRNRTMSLTHHVFGHKRGVQSELIFHCLPWDISSERFKH